MNLQFDNVEYFLLLLTIPFLYFLINKYNYWKIFVRTQFCDQQFINIFFSKINIYKRFILYSIFIIFITLSLVDTIKHSKKQTIHNQTIDIVCALDVSNSMNATDIIPSRLEKSKKIIENVIYNLPINKVGLVVFAGQAYTLIPMTNDINSFKLYLSSINSNIIDYQGTNIKNALKESIQLFNKNEKSKKILILISDGEDNFNKENSIIKLANQHNIQIISIGIGTKKGSLIPYSYKEQQIKYLTDKKQNIIITKLEEKKLQKISKNTFGIYINSSMESEYNIKKIINNILIFKKNNAITKFDKQIKNHYFQWYLLCALLIFIIIFLTNINNEFNI